MVIIFQQGKEFWIERVSVSVVIPDAAGETTGTAVSLERAGFFLGGSISISNVLPNDNAQGIGSIELRGLPTGQIILGTFVEQVRGVIQKQLGTAGNTTVSLQIMAFMRGRASA